MKISIASDHAAYNQKQEINMYPNPATSIINIKSIHNIDRISIFDIQSRVIFSNELNDKNTTIDVSNFSNGIYVIELRIHNKLIRKEFVIYNENK